jgi:hypothetical protein
MFVRHAQLSYDNPILARYETCSASRFGNPISKLFDGRNRNITLNCARDRSFHESLSEVTPYHRSSKRCLIERNGLLRRTMKGNRLNYTGNVIPFQMRSGPGRNPAGDARRDNILRMLDLSKFEQPRPAVEGDASMRANIAAMVLLGLLVFFAKEGFSKLGQTNLCASRSVCMN